MFGLSQRERWTEQRKAQRLDAYARYEKSIMQVQTKSAPLETLAKAEFSRRKIVDPTYNTRLRQAAALLEVK